jgi:hypothetical protein
VPTSPKYARNGSCLPHQLQPHHTLRIRLESVLPVAHGGETGITRSVPKQQSVDRSPPINLTDSKPDFEDRFKGATSPATQAAPPSEDQTSWQTDVESRLVSETKQVFVYQRSSPSYRFPRLAPIFSTECRGHGCRQSHHHSWTKN